MDIVALMVLLQLILESFPISSSGHLLLLQKYLNLSDVLPDEFDHFLHGPWVLVLAIFFYKEWKDRIWWFLPKSLMFKSTHKRHAIRLNKLACKILLYSFIANIITGILYFVLKLYKPVLESTNILLIGLFTTACLLLSLLLHKDDEAEGLTLTKSILLGFAQGVAILPGVSRFGVTYVIARHLKLSTRRAFQTSFLLQLPTAVVATLKGVLKLPLDIFTTWVILSFVVGTFLSYFGLWFSQFMAYKKKAWVFGVYLVVLLSMLLGFGIIS